MSERNCETRDSARGGSALLLWCLPVVALIVGLNWQKARPMLWIPAFLIMAAACIANAAQCGRRHCYVTGPVCLLAALYVALSALNLAPMHPGIFLFVVFGITTLACLAEGPFGEVQEAGAKGMKIEVLYFENCPNHVPTLERIHQVLREEGCDAEVREVLVSDVETAHNVRFLGSPTVRVNGLDIEPKAEERKDFGLMCRRYSSGIPSHELIREALRSALIGGSPQ